MIESYSSNPTLYKLVRNRNPENSVARPDPPPKPPSYFSNVDIIISYDWLIECCITHLQKSGPSPPVGPFPFFCTNVVIVLCCVVL